MKGNIEVKKIKAVDEIKKHCRKFMVWRDYGFARMLFVCLGERELGW